MFYIKLLQNPKWQKKRLEIMSRDNFSCILCLDNNSTLHVHHRFYLNGLKPWEYDDDVYMTLCATCHNYTHFEGDKAVLKNHIMQRYSHGTLPEYAVNYLFLEHNLRNI